MKNYMKKYSYYGGNGIYRNNKYIIVARTKKEAMEKAKKNIMRGITVSTLKAIKE